MCNIDLDVLPQSVKMGLPPAMGASFTMPFWGDVLQPPGDLSTEMAQAIGMPTIGASSYRAHCENRMLKDALQTNGCADGQHNARQAFAALKGAHVIPILPLPYRCTIDPPLDINMLLTKG